MSPEILFSREMKLHEAYALYVIISFFNHFFLHEADRIYNTNISDGNVFEIGEP